MILKNFSNLDQVENSEIDDFYNYGDVKMNNRFDCFIKILLGLLFAKFTYSFTVCNSPPKNFWEGCVFMTLIIICLNMSRIIKVFMGTKGIEIELNKIETTKKEIISIQENMKEVSKQMLHFNVTLIESMKRLTWNGLPNHDQLISIIEEHCKKLRFSQQEIDYVFETKKEWEENEKRD